jgi:GT2 family glycosyltransferase
MIDEFGHADPAARRRDPSLRELMTQRGSRRDLYLGKDPHEVLQRVDAVSGALMLMPLGLFLQLAGFDENFHLHVEDLDLCRRTREAGYEVLIANDLTVVHVGGVSSRSRPLWVEWQKHGSLWRYFSKFERATRRCRCCRCCGPACGATSSWPRRARCCARAISGSG